MAGYYNNPDKTNEVLTSDGWLYTGDLAKYYDEENICIVGRCKDMIIRVALMYILVILKNIYCKLRVYKMQL